MILRLKEVNEKEFRLVFDTSKEMLKDIDEKNKLTTSEDGKIYVQILRPDVKCNKKLPIKKEYFSKGIDTT